MQWKEGEGELQIKLEDAIDEILSEAEHIDSERIREIRIEIGEAINLDGIIPKKLVKTEEEPDDTEQGLPAEKEAPITEEKPKLTIVPQVSKSAATAKTMAELWTMVEKPADWDNHDKWSNKRKKQFFHKVNGGEKPEGWNTVPKEPLVTPLKPAATTQAVTPKPNILSKVGSTVREAFKPSAPPVVAQPTQPVKPVQVAEKPTQATPAKGKLSDGSDDPFAELAA